MILLPLTGIRNLGFKVVGGGAERHNLEIHFGCTRLACQLEIQAEISNLRSEKNTCVDFRRELQARDMNLEKSVFKWCVELHSKMKSPREI